jgi:predicted permease
MLTIILNSLAFLLTILFAFGLKQLKILKQADGQIVSKIVIWVTLPATIIVGVNAFKLTGMVFVLMGMGIVCNLLLIGTGWLLGSRVDKVALPDCALYMFNTGGYNIGNFTIPFVTSFFPTAVPFCAMLDMGNSFMVSGATQAIVETAYNQKRQGFDLRDVLRVLLKSPPFDVYIVMFLMAVFHVAFPANILVPVHFLASANSFLSLFMIGLFMEIELKSDNIALIGKLLLTRYAGAAILALVVYFILPLPHFVKVVVLLILFCPISFLTTIQATQFGVDEGKAGLAGSLSMFISLILMSLIVILLR